MRARDLALAIAALLLMPACADVPQTSGRIDQDIRGGTWMREQSPPVSPGILPPQGLGDQTGVAP